MRYKNCRIDATPTDKFTELVTIVKTPVKLKSLLGKKYISLDKAKIAVDYKRAIMSITKLNVTDELSAVVVLND